MVRDWLASAVHLDRNLPLLLVAVREEYRQVCWVHAGPIGAIGGCALASQSFKRRVAPWVLGVASGLSSDGLLPRSEVLTFSLTHCLIVDTYFRY
jgi:hypothetical protein